MKDKIIAYYVTCELMNVKGQWTRRAKKLLSQRVRIILIGIMCGHGCPPQHISLLKEHGFNERGYYEKGQNVETTEM